MKLHRLLFYIFLFLMPFQTRILYNPDNSYVSWYFDYHIALFLYLTDIILIACFTHWLVFDRPKSADVAYNRLIFIALGFISLCILTLFHVKRVDIGVYQTLKWLEFLLILIYIPLTVREEKPIKIVFGIVFISSILQALIGWFQFHVQHAIGWGWLGEYIAPLGTPGLSTIDTVSGEVIRAYGTMPHPNVLGAFLVFGLICGLYFVSRETSDSRFQTKILKLANYLGLIILSIGIFATFSRNAWIAAALAMICFIGYNLWSKRKVIAIGLAVIIIVSCATIFSLYNDQLQARVSDANNVSIIDRYFFNNLALEILNRFPTFGVGIGNYVPALLDLYELEPWQHQPPHNIFIFIAAELGIVGLGLFVWILFEIFRIQKTNFSSPLIFATYYLVITILLMSQFDHFFVTIQQGRLMFAVALGILAALPNLYDYQKSG